MRAAMPSETEKAGERERESEQARGRIDCFDKSEDSVISLQNRSTRLPQKHFATEKRRMLNSPIEHAGNTDRERDRDTETHRERERER